jgi:hypothetical protein
MRWETGDCGNCCISFKWNILILQMYGVGDEVAATGQGLPEQTGTVASLRAVKIQ